MLILDVLLHCILVVWCPVNAVRIIGAIFSEIINLCLYVTLRHILNTYAIMREHKPFGQRGIASADITNTYICLQSVFGDRL